MGEEDGFPIYPGTTDIDWPQWVPQWPDPANSTPALTGISTVGTTGTAGTKGGVGPIGSVGADDNLSGVSEEQIDQEAPNDARTEEALDGVEQVAESIVNHIMLLRGYVETLVEIYARAVEHFDFPKSLFSVEGIVAAALQKPAGSEFDIPAQVRDLGMQIAAWAKLNKGQRQAVRRLLDAQRTDAARSMLRKMDINSKPIPADFDYTDNTSPPRIGKSRPALRVPSPRVSSIELSEIKKWAEFYEKSNFETPQF